MHPVLQQRGCWCAPCGLAAGCCHASWCGDKVWHHSWISHEAADCNARPQRLLSLFLCCLALPNYVSECFYFDANHLCKELENKPEKDTPARTVCPWLGTMPLLMGCEMEPVQLRTAVPGAAGLCPTA